MRSSIVRRRSGTSPRARAGSPPRPLREHGMDRRSRAPARRADGGARTASRPKGGIERERERADATARLLREAAWPADARASPDSGRRTADRIPTEGATRAQAPRANDASPGSSSA